MKQKTYIFPNTATISARNAMEAFCIYNTSRIKNGLRMQLSIDIKNQESGRTWTVEVTVKEV